MNFHYHHSTQRHISMFVEILIMIAKYLRVFLLQMGPISFCSNCSFCCPYSDIVLRPSSPPLSLHPNEDLFLVCNSDTYRILIHQYLTTNSKTGSAPSFVWLTDPYVDKFTVRITDGALLTWTFQMLNVVMYCRATYRMQITVMCVSSSHAVGIIIIINFRYHYR